MCLNLLTVPNPYCNKKAYASEKGSLVTINPDLIPRGDYIQVPCGQCVECRQHHINEIMQRAIVEGLQSYLYFVTLTYDNKHIPFLDICGNRYLYADYDDIQLMMKRFRAANILDRQFRYMAVNEYGDESGRPHFHLIIFVPILPTDDEVTGYHIEQLLFANLGNFFAKNVGTRKNPVYEKLFTYKTNIQDGKYRANYYVQYVERNTPIDFTKKIQCQDTNYIKTIRYIIGYLNKPNEHEDSYLNVIEEFFKDTDIVLYTKLKRLLKSQVRYSKGFGSGFDSTGKKYYMEKISCRCSSNTHVYTEITKELPKLYEEFCRLYPEFNAEVLEWRERDFYQHFSTWKRCINGMTADEYMLHCVYLFYFRDEFNSRYNRYKKDYVPTIASTFSKVSDKYMYSAQKVITKEIESTPIYEYLRGMVNKSIEIGLPCLSFIMEGEQRYIPLCKYYRNRVCTLDDTYNLYTKLGVKNFEEWLKLFEDVKKTNKSQILESSNKYRFYNCDRLDSEEVQELYSSLHLYNKI